MNRKAASGRSVSVLTQLRHACSLRFWCPYPSRILECLRSKVYIAAAAVRLVLGRLRKLRIVVVLWLVAFLPLTTFMTFVFFGSPILALKLALFDLKSTNAFVVGDCVIGSHMKYKYTVANRDYISEALVGPCSQPIPDQAKLLIYYVEREPEVSVDGKHPKGDILFILAVSALVSALAVRYFIVKYEI